MEDNSLAEAEEALPSSPLVSRVKRLLLLKQGRENEDIEDAKLEGEEKESSQNEGTLQSVEDREVVPDSEEETQSLKRRRSSTPPQPHSAIHHTEDVPVTTAISSSPFSTASPPPFSSPPSLLRSPNPSSHDVQSYPRFRFSHPSNSTGTSAANGLTASRPSFVLPPTPLENDKSVLLPEAYSPHRHRRGLKYVPDGLAATVRDWALDVSNISRGARTGGMQKEGSVTVLEVEDISAGAGIALVAIPDDYTHEDKFMTEDSAAKEEQREPRTWLLIGEGSQILSRGSRVGVNAPVWDIQIGEQKYRVGLDWQKLCESAMEEELFGAWTGH